MNILRICAELEQNWQEENICWWTLISGGRERYCSLSVYLSVSFRGIAIVLKCVYLHLSWIMHHRMEKGRERKRVEICGTSQKETRWIRERTDGSTIEEEREERVKEKRKKRRGRWTRVCPRPHAALLKEDSPCVGQRETLHCQIFFWSVLPPDNDLHNVHTHTHTHFFGAQSADPPKLTPPSSSRCCPLVGPRRLVRWIISPHAASPIS